MITFSCDSCARKYRVDDALAGRKVKCKGCGTGLTIPSPAAGAVAVKPPAVDLYGLEDEAPDEAPLPPPRRPGAAVEPVGRGRKTPRRAISEENESQFRRVGFTFIGFGLLSFVLPLVGLQVKGLHALGTGGQVAGGIGLIALGGLCLAISRFGVLKGLGLGVGGAAGLLALLFAVASLTRGRRPPRGAAGPPPAVAIPGPFDPMMPPEFADRGGGQIQPDDRGRVTVLGGQAGPAGGIGGVTFRIDYRVDVRTPGAMHYDVIVKSSKGRTRIVPPVLLKTSGTIGVTIPEATRDDGPFEVGFEIERIGPGGPSRFPVSDLVAAAWSDEPAADQPPFGGPPPGVRPPGMPNVPPPPIPPRFGPR